MHHQRTVFLVALVLLLLLSAVAVSAAADETYVLRQSLSKVSVTSVAPLGGLVVHAQGNGLVGNGETYVHFVGFERDRNMVRFQVFSKWNGLSTSVVREYEVTIPVIDGKSEWFTFSLAPVPVGQLNPMTIELKIDSIDAQGQIHMAEPRNMVFKTGK